MVTRAIQLNNFITVGWSVRSLDTVIKDSRKLLHRISKNLKNGDVVLFHDFSDHAIEILPEFIEHAKRLGLKIVRIDQLLGERPYA